MGNSTEALRYARMATLSGDPAHCAGLYETRVRLAMIEALISSGAKDAAALLVQSATETIDGCAALITDSELRGSWLTRVDTHARIFALGTGMKRAIAS